LDWSSFDETLRVIGPRILGGIDDEVRELVEWLAVSTDEFFSADLQATLVDRTDADGLRAGVVAALDVWRGNVVDPLSADFAIDLDWSSTAIDPTSPLVEELVQAARPTDADDPENAC